MSLEQLVIEAQAASGGEAFAEVCQRFTGLVKKYAGQPHLAGLKEEAVAEGWLAVAAAVRTYNEAAGVRFAGYVESRVKYAVWNLFKRERRRWERELPLTGGGQEEEGEMPGLIATLAAAGSVEDTAESLLAAKAIRQALAKLPGKQRTAVVKSIVGEAQLADIAAELGVTPQAVYGLRQRGLARLKKELAKNFF